jgi:hypothetical protein
MTTFVELAALKVKFPSQALAIHEHMKPEFVDDRQHSRRRRRCPYHYHSLRYAPEVPNWIQEVGHLIFLYSFVRFKGCH